MMSGIPHPNRKGLLLDRSRVETRGRITSHEESRESKGRETQRSKRDYDSENCYQRSLRQQVIYSPSRLGNIWFLF